MAVDLWGIVIWVIVIGLIALAVWYAVSYFYEQGYFG